MDKDLKDLKNAFIGHCKELKCETNYIKVCEKKFSKIEKELKALEIIKNKQVHIARLNRCDNVLQYNMGTMFEERYLTEEEWNYLKEVML